MSDINYDQLAEAIAQKLRLLPAPDAVIWTAKQCAEYLSMSERNYVDRISKSYNFPTPIKLPSESGGLGHARWYAHEIQAWVGKHKRAS